MMLCFHTFEENSSYSFNFTIQEFLFILDVLRDKKIQHNISIDDAHITTIQAAIEALKLGYTPLLGIPVGRIQNESNTWLSWKDLIWLRDCGCEIASHGFNHIELKEENEQFFKQEIETSKNILEKKLNEPINSFIYPRGVFCPKAISIVKNNYKRAYSILHSSFDTYLLPRYMLSRFNYKKFLMELKNV